MQKPDDRNDYASTGAIRPAAWMVRQGSRTYYVGDAEFVRSSYDSGEFVPLYPPEAIAAERERCARVAEQQAEYNGLAAGWHIAAEIRGA